MLKYWSFSLDVAATFVELLLCVSNLSSASSIIILTISNRPFSEARWSGVVPFNCAGFTFFAFDSINEQTFLSPLDAALQNCGVDTFHKFVLWSTMQLSCLDNNLQFFKSEFWRFRMTISLSSFGNRLNSNWLVSVTLKRFSWWQSTGLCFRLSVDDIFVFLGDQECLLEFCKRYQHTQLKVSCRLV